MKTPKADAVILVPFALDGSMIHLVEAAGAIALKTGARLKLLNIIKPFHIGLMSESFDSSIAKVIENEQIRLVEAAFRQAKEVLPAGISVSMSYEISGNIPEAILKFAAAESAVMVMCGIANISHKFLPKGISTVLSLLANSPIPVMALPQLHANQIRKNGFNILVADDLQAAGLSATRFAVEWALNIEAAKVYHIHVNRVLKEQFVASFYASYSYGTISVPPAINPEDLYLQYTLALKSKLSGRVKEFGIESDHLQGRYETLLVSGDLSEEISQAAEETSADLIVFGRHHLIHTKPLGIGAISYRMMLEQKRPILVMPLKS